MTEQTHEVLEKVSPITNNEENIQNQQSNSKITPGYLLEISTTKVSIILKLIDALKDVFKDITLRIIPKVYKNGKISDNSAISIIEFNKIVELFIKIVLYAKEFDKYEVKGNSEIFLSLDMLCLSKIFKSIPATAKSITFFVEEKNPSKFGITIVSDHNDIRTVKLNIINSNIHNYSNPHAKYSAIITIPSNKFNNIIKPMSTYTDILRITYTNTATTPHIIQISCNSDIIPEDTHTIHGLSSNNEDVPIQNILISGTFDIKVICSFLKFGLISPNLTIYMRHDDAYIFEYNVANLGLASFVVSQKHKTSIDDQIEDNIQIESDDEM